MKRVRLAAALLLIALGCSNDRPVAPLVPGASGAGHLTLTFTTPNTDDAALLFELRGPGIKAIRTSNPATQLFADSSGTTIRGAIFGSLTVGALATFEVPDTTTLGDYTASVLDVAGPDNSLRSITGYSLRVAP